MQIKWNKQQLRDKIRACWIAKNIGGTVGAPYEGTTELLDVKGIISRKGEAIPNDDLDLQLIWLTVMEQVGPRGINANVLGDYWLSYIPAHWNEYGVGKANLRLGLLPPLSGEFRNEKWKYSNGAWIRSEIWACLAPGFPNIAIKYAYMDATIDHGTSEGTFAEIFTAALESLAFVETDIRSVIEHALEYIPDDCRIAKSVRMVLAEYDKGTPWQTLRNMIVADNEDIGWFQAPANIAYVILGLMYGQGDFKKSVILSVNCGDDTDCTGATCAAILGIMGGMQALPEDWVEHIGDRIIMVSADCSYYILPKSCTEMTDRIMEMIPTVLKANGEFFEGHHGIYMEYTDGETNFDKERALQIQRSDNNKFHWLNEMFAEDIREMLQYAPWYFQIENVHIGAVVQYETEPVVTPNSAFKVKVHLKNYRQDPTHLDFHVSLPEGWTADYRRMDYISHWTSKSDARLTWEMTIHTGEEVVSINKVSVWVTPVAHPLPLMLPLVLLG